MTEVTHDYSEDSHGPSGSEEPDFRHAQFVEADESRLDREQRPAPGADVRSSAAPGSSGTHSPLLTVITPTIPGREEDLVECRASVAAQTVPAADHIVICDVKGSSLAGTRNRLIEQVETEWYLALDDDDIIYPTYVEKVTPYFADADIVYTWCDKNFDYPTDLLFDGEALRQRNVIPATACVRTELLREVGGYPTGVAHEDWGLWLKMLDVGARFVCVPERLWSYRRKEDGLHARVNAQADRGEIPRV